MTDNTAMTCTCCPHADCTMTSSQISISYQLRIPLLSYDLSPHRLSNGLQPFSHLICFYLFFFFFQAEDGIRDWSVTGVQTCALPIWSGRCASAQIARQLAILGNEQARPAQRNESLKWIVHLVGDIHQPLHAANHADREDRKSVV